MTGEYVLKRLQEEIKDLENITYLHCTIANSTQPGKIARHLFVGAPQENLCYYPDKEWFSYVLTQHNIASY